MKQKVAFYTLGCKVNQYETNAMKQNFIEKGYEIVEYEEYADIYVINTCTVTNMSDRKSRQVLRRAKQINSKSIVVVTGCYVQVAKEEIEKIKEIDVILGNNEKKEIVDKIEDYINKNQKQKKITDVMQKREFVEFGNTTYTEKTRAVIKIQDGCDRFCSYCIIPYARGRVRSRKIENILEEVKLISKKEIKEIVITGIHIASYGKDFKEDIKLIDLLEKLNEIDGIKRIRLGSLEPSIITNDFVQRLKKLEKICDQFHLSLQSACNSTLERMNRKYKIEEFKEAVKLLRENYKNVLLTADVIVGFPGETEEEFNTTYKNLDEIKFYKMHIFKYSQRKGTKAAIMKNQIDGKIKDERSQKLIEMSNKFQQEYNKAYIGKKVEVLFEERENEFVKGHTSNFIEVKVETKENLDNQIKMVKINKIDKENVIGELIK